MRGPRKRRRPPREEWIVYSLSSLETFTELKKDPQTKIDHYGASCGRKLGGAARRLRPRVQGVLRGGESKGNLRFQRL